ncbi:MAG: ferrochelatase [Nitrospirae bacterium]|nr:ferrochelatase [Candidatus Troglogloeales bacterium]
MNKIAVLLMAHGGPDSLDDIEPFLGHIMKGRVPSAEIIATVKDRYSQIGGKSPLLEITNQQAAALEAKLNARGNQFRVYVGMRHWTPYIKETVREILQDKPTYLVAISMAPQYSRLSVGAYIETVRGALADLGGGDLAASFVPHWHTQPLLLDAFSKKVKSRLLEYPESIRSTILLVFTAHSLPESILAEGDAYPAHLQETMHGIVKRLGALLPPENIKFAYQSKGMSGGKWLGPDIEDVLKEAEANADVLMAPIGFVADHVEILYDIDIYYKEMAKDKGINLNRIESLNTAPLFIHALASVVHASLPL